MTAEPVERSRGLCFIDDAPAFPLIDPTDAAARLGVQRHTLACYRNLGGGPRWFKFGRWVRYSPDDLNCWRAGERPAPARSILRASWLPDRETRHALVQTVVAARVLTVTRPCLLNYRLEGVGPPHRHCGRRVYYSLGDLIDWAVSQARE